MQPCRGDAVFLGESKSTLFGTLLLGIIKITYNRTAMHFMDDRFVNLGNSDFAMTIYDIQFNETIY